MCERIRILVFGGSFNPIHFGHINILEQCIEKFYIDKAIIIPCGQNHPFNKKIHYQTEYRVRSIELLIKKSVYSDIISIDNIEISKNDRSYTIDTLDHIASVYKESNKQMYFLLGDDLISSFNKWKGYEEIFSRYEMIIAHRSLSIEETMEIIDRLFHKYVDRIHLLGNKIISISSSYIRSKEEMKEEK